MNENEQPEASKEEVMIEPFWPERNLLTLPFFSIDKKVDKDIIEYRGTVREDNREITFEWIVYGNIRGLPTQFDWQVHRAIEEMLSEMPLPIANPLAFSIYEVVERMRVKHSGNVYERVRESIERLIVTAITSKAAFYSKSKRQRLRETFHLYERVVYKDDLLDDNTVAETNYLWLNSWFLDNINLRFTKPLDREYYHSLGKPSTKRIYEVIGVKFFGLPGKHVPLRQNYVDLCQLLGFKVQPHLSWAKKILKTAHEELVSTGFIAEVQWIKEGKSPDEWFIAYTMGDRAVAEMEQARAGSHMPPRVRDASAPSDPGPKPAQAEPAPEIEPGSDTPATEPPLVVALVERDVLLKTAKQLVEAFPESKVERVIEYTDWYKTQRNRVRKWGAYIARLIKDPDFAVSADFLRDKAEAVEQQQEQARRGEAEVLRAKRLEAALAHWSDERYLEQAFDEMRQRHQAMAQWVQKTDADVEKEQARIRASLPADEEGRIQVLLQHEHFQLDSILKELDGDTVTQPPPFVVEEGQAPAQAQPTADTEAHTDAPTESQLSFLDTPPTDEPSAG